MKNMLRYKTKTRPGLVALYDIRPGNGAGPFLQPRSPHGAISLRVLADNVSVRNDRRSMKLSRTLTFSYPIRPTFQIIECQAGL